MCIYMLFKWFKILCFFIVFCAHTLNFSVQNLTDLATPGFKFPDPFAHATGSTLAYQGDTLLDLERVLSIVSQGDCVVVAGDFNEQLPSQAADRTGKYVGGQASANADRLVELMLRHDLIAANTLFAPKRHASVNASRNTEQVNARSHVNTFPDEMTHFNEFLLHILHPV